MITSYEVGAIFRIQDDVTPALGRIFAEATRVDRAITTLRTNLARLGRIPGLTQLNTQLAGTARQLASIATAGARAGTATASALGPLNAQLSAATVNAQALNASLAAAAATARTVRIPRGGGAGGGAGAGGHGGGRGLHVSSLGFPVPGGHARVSGNNAAMLGLGALAYGIYQEAQVEDIAARAFITGQMHVDAGMTHTDAFKELRSIITKNAISGGFSPHEVGEAVLGSERQFAGLDFRKRMSVLNTMIPFAMQEARLKETPLKESAEALVGLAHMTGTYDTDKLPDLYRKFAYASQLTPKSLPQYTTALSYAMPSLVGGMGMDPDAIMFLTAMNQAAGIGSSKAGTWIQAFFSKLMPETGINLTRSKKLRNAALTELGLTDEHDKALWMVKRDDGKTDWMASLVKLAPILGSGLAKLPDEKRMQYIDQVFGKQGGREAGLMNLPEFIGQFPQLARQLQMASGGEDVLKQLREGSPVQQARTAWSEMTVVLMDMATVVLPPLTGALKDFHGVLKALGSVLPGGATGERSSIGSLIGKRAMEGTIAGAGVGFFTTGVGAIPGAAIGFGVGATYGLVEGVWPDAPAPAAVGQNPGWWRSPVFGGGSGGGGQAGGGTLNLTVKAETDRPDALAEAVASRLAALLASAGLHNLGGAEGVNSSAYNAGSPLP